MAAREPAEMGPTRSVAVLAGGASRRMGHDKRLADVGGRPLLHRVVEVVRGVCPRVSVVAGGPGVDLDLPTDVAVVADRWPGEGPLGGLVTALEAAGTDLVLVLAADHPDLVPDLLVALLEDAAQRPACDAVVLVDDAGRPQPLVAVYRSGAADRLRAAFDQGERRAAAVVDLLDAHLVAPREWRPHDPLGRSLRDVDTPEALAAAQRDHHQRSARTEVHRITADGRLPDRVAEPLGREEPLRIRAAGPGEPPRDVVTTMRSPGNEADLAVGWLFTEGLYDPAHGPAQVVLGDPREVAMPEDEVTVHLPHPLALDAAAHRHATATASCGVCGRASIDELAARCAPVPLDHPTDPLPAATVLDLPDRLRRAQAVYAATGGVHATGLFRGGDLEVLREDVGRHNALDAAIGARVRTGHLDVGELVAVLSGRIGFELVAKAAAAGLPVVVAVGAPTDLAVRTADRLGITLVGFVRDGRGNVYSHPHRVGG